MLPEILIHGGILSATFILLALGFSLVFGVANLINLAHTAFYMLCAYFIYIFGIAHGIHPLGSAGISIALVSLLGMLSYKLCIRRVRKYPASMLIISLALALAIQELVILSVGSEYHAVPEFISGYLELGGIRILNQQLLVLAITAASCLSLWIFLSTTRWGLAIRAVSEDLEAASLMGIDVERAMVLSIGLASMLAGIAAAIVAPLFVIEPTMWIHPLVVVLAVVILGGLGSLRGSIVAGCVLAYTETCLVFLAPAGAFLRGAAAMSIMLATLLLRPAGIFGIKLELE